MVEFLKAAEADLQLAAAWYEERNPSVARAFISEVQRSVGLIARHSGMGQQWDDPRLSRPVRRLSMRRFPYSLVYLDSEVLLIVAIMHQRRRADAWLHRLSDLG